MNLHDVENLTFAELKEQREAIAAELAATVSQADLATRYVQARTDAKQRDEKLAEQGRTITLLHEQLAACKAQATEQAERADTLAASLALSDKSLAAEREALAAMTAEARASDKLAMQRRAVLVDIMAFAGKLNEKIAPLLVAE